MMPSECFGVFQGNLKPVYCNPGEKLKSTIAGFRTSKATVSLMGDRPTLVPHY